MIPKVDAMRTASLIVQPHRLFGAGRLQPFGGACRFSLLLLLAITALTAIAFGQVKDRDLDQYSIRITGFWLYSSPTVTLSAAGNNGSIQFNQDFAFRDYSTVLGKIDWKFTRKNHLYFTAAPFNQSNQVALNRTITFQGQSYTVGAIAKGQLRATMYSPGYQYDILRGRHGHLGIATQVNFFHTTGSISAAAQVTGNGVQQAASSASASLLAPIPVAGPEFRIYLTKSQRLFINGNVFGMYLFGYGNYASTTDYLGVSLFKHLSIDAGYAVGSRLRVNDQNNRVGLNLVQRGPIVGMDVSF